MGRIIYFVFPGSAKDKGMRNCSRAGRALVEAAELDPADGKGWDAGCGRPVSVPRLLAVGRH